MDTSINNAIDNLARQVASSTIVNPLLIGIHTGGVWVAELLHQKIGFSEELGTLDISFYRDDFSRVGLNPQVKASFLPVRIEDRNIILIDDVLYTGRTIRAALNEIFSYGRPASVKLGVLIKRTGRELPIQSDFIGMELDLDIHQQAKLYRDNDKLGLSVEEVNISEK
ncbi:MAG: bifunctional pyr operon transcriptional regulator/uracil phosphoribosyltransferase PyrR [Gammaproteobacteria bacterium]|nr:bifunctional pyr operon transcriptional regulator/uracil phosphoribosyltransferase PyrR [Gammaproteobacteria bacterium]MCY4218383.1 bifunctional pyr operon transcriptional regulator/uracil phosphoribosyltransferase PyrR [Gammaproteobacteria bacterium]MCY4274289.1 bifunctional pyr operon transcriptional regulator/uracil phosphoribosyltransferase PyrR [Gammaproteobacteria bacterium]